MLYILWSIFSIISSLSLIGIKITSLNENDYSLFLFQILFEFQTIFWTSSHITHQEWQEEHFNISSCLPFSFGNLFQKYVDLFQKDRKRTSLNELFSPTTAEANNLSWNWIILIWNICQQNKKEYRGIRRVNWNKSETTRIIEFKKSFSDGFPRTLSNKPKNLYYLNASNCKFWSLAEIPKNRSWMVNKNAW